uniref:Uncharacterized protein n=1 Tax=Panagrolaimus sp. ES5 TaxID=591445 RepID=A0AC34G1F2_9BILA
MRTLLNSDAITTQLKYDGYSDVAFERTETLYKNMMKQVLVAFPTCEILVFGKIYNKTKLGKRNDHLVKFVAEIEGKLKEENIKRQEILKQIQMSELEFQALKSRVETYKKLPKKGWEIHTFYGKAKCNEHFAILVQKVVIKININVVSR